MNARLDKIAISTLQLKDLKQVVQLEEETGLSSWGVVGYEREILNSNALMLKATQDTEDDLLGFLMGRKITDEFELFSIAVVAEARQRGIGSALLSVLIDVLVQDKIRHCWLEVRAQNLAAISLYKKHGFQVVGRRVGYYRLPLDDALIMHWEFDRQGIKC